MKFHRFILVLPFFIILSCGQQKEKPAPVTFQEDIDFLKQYTDVVVLSDESGKAQVATVPGMQGRIMTSTADGPEGISFGWINRQLIQSGENNPHINAYGGEDRFWLGPEGGQFSIFFKNGDPFDLEHWFTPPPINEGAYDVVAKGSDRILFRKAMHLVNYSKAEFDLELNRQVRLLPAEEISQRLGMELDSSLKVVAFESNNTITNTGSNAWKKESGLLSIWILGMFNPSPKTTVVVPFIPGPEDELGPIVNDRYFGKVPSDRLVIKEDVIFFLGDGKYRSKIGVSRKRCKPILGSYDAINKVLTLVQFNLPEDAVDYVNSMWEIQDKPYQGDVVNSYNDGPTEPGGKPLGPFYELETSSPAAALKPGESLLHTHRTIHLLGDEAALDKVAQKQLGVSIDEIKNAFK